MRQLQVYVTEGWRFAGMKHVYLILKFLSRHNSWALDVIPEVRARGAILQVPGHTRGGCVRLRRALEDQDWLQYTGVPQNEAEQAVLAKITRPSSAWASAPHRKDGLCSHGETRTRSQENRREDRDAQGPSTATTTRFKCCEATPSPTTQGQQQGRFPGPRLPGQHGPSSPVAWPDWRVACRSATSTPPHRFAAPRLRIQWPAKTKIVSKFE
ncbi:hypothetical protein MRX96_053059 [Rhipicephalus microplus]